jgi:hypothetical protein
VWAFNFFGISEILDSGFKASNEEEDVFSFSSTSESESMTLFLLLGILSTE